MNKTFILILFSSVTLTSALSSPQKSFTCEHNPWDINTSWKIGKNKVFGRVVGEKNALVLRTYRQFESIDGTNPLGEIQNHYLNRVFKHYREHGDTKKSSFLGLVKKEITGKKRINKDLRFRQICEDINQTINKKITELAKWKIKHICKRDILIAESTPDFPSTEDKLWRADVCSQNFKEIEKDHLKIKEILVYLADFQTGRKARKGSFPTGSQK